ncbi:MAG: RsmE family RNA methyltransferase [Acidimicrobiales bacterium]
MTPAPAPEPSPVAHVFVADLDELRLDEADHHHLVQVLRGRAGELVTASDGAGRWRPCRLGPGGALQVCGDVVEVPAGAPALTVGVALTKGARLEVAVQKLTELGVDHIVPIAAARSVVRWVGERADHHLRRLRRVAREAAMQSRRVHLPQIAPVAEFAAAAGMPGAALAQPGGSPPSLARAVLLVGPEGGWAPEELAYDLPTVGLGPQVLRAETAAIAAGTLLVALRSGIVTESGDRWNSQ